MRGINRWTAAGRCANVIRPSSDLMDDYRESRMETINTNNGGQVRSWAPQVESSTIEQALRTARSDAVSGPIALMPDAHWGLGATIGSVIPTESAIIPAAVGVDIGCGMVAVETDLDASDLPDDLTGVLHGIAGAVPAGFGRHQQPKAEAEAWLRRNPLQTDVNLASKQERSVAQQLGTLGGGNHFVEVCIDERDVVWVVLHSGSRGIGNILARSHIQDAKKLCKDLDRATEDRDLAYFLVDDPEFQAYVADMLWSQNYALYNRELMMDAVVGVLTNLLHREIGQLARINCHHNYTERENHDGRDLWITRKGAIRARQGDRGVIPGSMGTGTFVVSGLGEPQSYNSASHGAGRAMGRKEARRRLSVKEFNRSMKGRTWQHTKAMELLDEAPMAYKDITKVMANQADLVRIDHRLEAVVNYKGTT